MPTYWRNVKKFVRFFAKFFTVSTKVLHSKPEANSSVESHMKSYENIKFSTSYDVTCRILILWI